MRIEIPGIGGDFINDESGGGIMGSPGGKLLGAAGLGLGAWYAAPYLFGGAGASTAAGAAGTGASSWAPWALMGAQALGGAQTNAANRGIAQDQMNFQERMSSTAHQREAWDLEQAGLNRLLTLGGGASTPAGAGATMQNPLEGAVSNAVEASMLKNTLAKQSAEIDNIRTSTKLTEAQQNKVRQETRALGRDAERGEFFEGVWKKIKEAGASGTKSINDALEWKKYDNNLYQGKKR